MTYFKFILFLFLFAKGTVSCKQICTIFTCYETCFPKCVIIMQTRCTFLTT